MSEAPQVADPEAIADRLKEGVARRLTKAIEDRAQKEIAKGAKGMGGYGAPQLAQEIGVSRQAVSSWTRGAHLPALELVAAAAEVLGVSPSWLAFGG